MQQDEHTLLIIGFCMLCVHVGAIYWSAVSRTPNAFVPKVERCVVNTISLHQKMPQEEKKEEKKEKKKKKIFRKKEAVKRRETIKRQETKHEKKKHLFAEAKKKLEKIRSSPKLDDLAIVHSLEVDAVEISGYEEVLSFHLRQVLRLPEFGQVNVKLTVDSEGHVVSVEMIGTESVLNSKYLEKALPSIQFPPFGKHFHNEAKHTFLVTLTNDA